MKRKVINSELLVVLFKDVYISKLFELFEVSGDWVEIEFG